MNEGRGEDSNWLSRSFTLLTTCVTLPILGETSRGFFGAQMTLRIIEEVDFDCMFSVVIFRHCSLR